VLDSFRLRGIQETVTNQGRISSHAMIGDAYTALRLLAGHPAIDPQPIGIMGFSKGGVVSLNSAFEVYRRFYLGASPLRFAFPGDHPPRRRPRARGAPAVLRPLPGSRGDGGNQLHRAGSVGPRAGGVPPGPAALGAALNRAAFLAGGRSRGGDFAPQ
jgi:hypothetical protein